MGNKQISIIANGYYNLNQEGYRDWYDNTVVINSYLESGWRVISSNPMGAFGCSGGEEASMTHGFASLIILEKQDN